MKVFLGWDSSQLIAWNIAAFSLQKHASARCDVRRIAMPELRAQGLYRRPTGHTDHGYWDDISGAPMSTGHAIARFLVPALCNYQGWALFTDGDVLFRADVAGLFQAYAESDRAVHVVRHQHVPQDAAKMSGEVQTTYARKNWSSVILWNCGHPANRALTVDLVNSLPGRDLHRFCWLEDDLIGALSPSWNVLIGEESTVDTAIAHFTLGTPDLKGYEHQRFSDEWYAAAKACGYRLYRPAKPMAVSA